MSDQQVDPVETGTHTPGQWLVALAAGGTGRPQIIHAVNGCVQRIVMQRGGAVSMADARLIAAAPDLLAALKLLHDNLAEYQRLNHLGGYDNHDMQMARAAIQKAEGPRGAR